MTTDETIFAEARALPAAERAAFLARACGDDHGLRANVEALLRGWEEFAHAAPPVRPADWSTPAAEQAGDVIGRYRLAEKLGEGGCGVVWLAEQSEPVKRQVALKVIKLGMDTKEVIARFEAERQALALMDHPNIAKVFDAGTTGTGRPFFVMELVRGVPITRYCDEAQFSTKRRLQLFIQVCQAIQHAHQKGIIHRDIKPSNILVTQHDNVAVPKVIDFGIAKATQGRLTDATVFTAFAQFIGTPAYMSPEQADFNALDVDTRSDVYSLGVLLYELLTGRPPFDPKSLHQAGLEEIRRIIREVDPPRPSTRLSTLSGEERTSLARQRGTEAARFTHRLFGDLDWIVMKALEKNRTRRYESASAFASDVQRFLGHEPVIARPPSPTYALGKLLRRHRLAFTAAAAVGLAVLGGAVIATWQAVRATRAEHEQGRLRGIEVELRTRAEAQALASRRQAYASDLNLIQQALAIHNLGRAQELLNRQRPKPGEVDLRGWEWRYLWQFCRSEEQSSLEGQPIPGGVRLLTLSSDGEWLAIGMPGGGLWNLRTRERRPLPAANDLVVNRAALVPKQPWIVTRSEPSDTSRVTVWNYLTNEIVREWPAGRGNGRHFGVSANGEFCFSYRTSEDGILVWRIATGELVRDIPKVRGAVIALSDDGRLIALEGGGGSVSVSEVATGRQLWSAKVAIEQIPLLLFSPDGRMLLTAGTGTETALRLWNVADGKPLGELSGHRGWALCAAFWPDGRTVATGAQDQTIRIWNVETKQLLRTLHGHRDYVTNLALLPDGVTLASSGSDRTVRFWNTSGAAAPGARSQLAERVVRWTFASDSQSVIALDPAAQVAAWRGRDFSTKETLLRVPDAVLAVQDPRPWLSAEPARVAIPRDGGHLQVWDWQRGELIRDLATPASGVFAVGFREGGRKLLLNYFDPATAAVRGLHEWDLVTGERTRSWPRTASVGEYVLSPDGRFCFVHPDNPLPSLAGRLPPTPPECQIIDLESNQLRPFPALPFGFRSGQFSPNNRFFSTVVGRQATVYELGRTPFPSTKVADLGGIQSLAFSPDTRRLAVAAGGFEAITVFDTENWSPLITLDAPASMFTQTAFSPDGNVLGSMSNWSYLHLWRAPSWDEIAAVEAAERKN